MEGDAAEGSSSKRALIIIGIVIVLVVVVAAFLVAVSALVQNPATTETLRDVAIILVALEGMLIGTALIILIVQLARLTALLENELKPMLEMTHETLSTVRGTTTFMSEHITQPVMMTSGVISAVRRALELLSLGRVR
jgi:PDZ domain-containing secreted protein